MNRQHTMIPACRIIGRHDSADDHWMIAGAAVRSPINGRPIVGLINLASVNAKTAGAAGIPTAGLYVIDAGAESPFELIRSGRDDSTCGTCTLRSGAGCYVNPVHGAARAYDVWRRGAARPFDPAVIADVIGAWSGLLRFGEYGEAAFLPYDVIDTIARAAGRWTGYTHAWTYCDKWAPRGRSYREFFMASVSTDAGAARAHSLGWRTFRARPADAALAPGEIACPASKEMNHARTCSQCGACNGTVRDSRSGAASVSIVVHGAGAARAAAAVDVVGVSYADS